ncbi:MAG TPA: hypothetical protein VI485_06565 [Vicinamibacterales bacterium]|nr:hypothetical protein [Vicinamibacterales bacterium]
MSRRALGVIVINAIVFCVLAEAVALFLYYNDTGRLFYSYRKAYEPIAETREGRLSGDGLHPYFGPTHREGYPFDIPESLRESASARARLATNNFGFVSPRNYPFTKTSARQYVIGIFGGSVGAWFCQVGVHRLLQDLERNAFFMGKELVPLCLSHEGYKQPQQLLVLSYFLSIGQQFDLVVNIDGFNEVALASLNHQRGLDISMPSVMHLDPLVNLVNQSTLTPEKLQSLAAISEYKTRINHLIDRMQRTRIAAIDFVLARLYRSALNSYQVELGRFSNLPSNPSASSLILATPSVKARDEKQLYDDVAHNWSESSLLMNGLLTARGVPYFHVLQPNQYFTTRAFSAGEAKVARSDGSPFKGSIEKGYPVLVAESDAGALKAVNFFSALSIFDREPSAVYMDDCCHYTLKGNQLLADFIAGRILASKGPWR